MEAGRELKLDNRRVWVLPLLLVVAYAGIQAAAFAILPERDPSGAVTRAGIVSIDELLVGDCFNWVDVSGGTARQVELQPCDAPHDARATGQTLFPASSRAAWPGDSDLESYAFDHCSRIATPNQHVATITPSEESWEDGDRSLICVHMG